MAKLTAKARNHLASSTFAGPDRSYPIPDASHARNALARASGKPVAPEVRAAVHRKFPGIGAKPKRYAQGVADAGPSIADMRKAIGPQPPPKPETPSSAQQINQNFGAMKKAMGYASGTTNVPAPGQTQTNGSWGTSAPPPAPLPPSPLGGQNQNLRALLGMGKPRFARGTTDVGGENGLTRAMNAHADQCHPVRR
jgi:hypothetical protein